MLVYQQGDYIMSKVLILANNDVGLYKFRKDLILELLKSHDVYISLPDGELVTKLVELGCHFIDTPINRRGLNPVTDMKLLLKYISIINKIKPDLVITYTIKCNLYGGTACRLFNTPLAINITGLGTAFQKEGLLKKFVTKWYKFVCKKIKVVFFENKGNCDTFITNNIITEDKACVLNGAGVNLEKYPFTSYPNTNNIRFLFIGRVMKEKGVDELFDAATRIKQQYNNIIFDIVGPMEDNYKDIIDDLVNKNIINYHGYQEDVKPFIEQSHCFVLPSYHEGMANTLLECASMGRPLITSNIHGCLEAIHNNGYLVNVKDKEDLYIKIKEFIELDDDSRKQLGINSRKHVEEVFDKKKVVERTMKELK